MKEVTVYHNPRCSKSREVLAILQEKKINCKIINYIKNPIEQSELVKVLKFLRISASELVRKKDSLFKEVCKDATKLTENDYLRLLLEYPSLMQRPIVVSNTQAIIGRPPELVLKFMTKQAG